MFFKDINKWSMKRLRLYALAFNCLYLVFTCLAPIIVVGCRYQIFHKVSAYRLTGWGWICAILVAVVSIKVIKKVVDKLPEVTYKQQLLKYSILGVRALFIPVLLLIAMTALKSDFDLAYNTLWLCLIFYTIGIVIDYTCIKYIDRAKDIKIKAMEKIVIDDAVNELRGE